MNKSPMEIIPNLSPMDINYQHDKYCDSPDSHDTPAVDVLDPDTPQVIKETGSPTDYPLEPPQDDLMDSSATDLDQEWVSEPEDEEADEVEVKSPTKTKEKPSKDETIKSVKKVQKRKTAVKQPKNK